MLKYILLGFVLSYVLRRFLFQPLPGSQKSQQLHQKKARGNSEYTDYEELD